MVGAGLARVGEGAASGVGLVEPVDVVVLVTCAVVGFSVGYFAVIAIDAHRRKQ